MLPDWDATTWLTAVACFVAVASLALAYVAWQHPRSPKPPKPQPHEQVRVSVTNLIPIFTQPDGSQRPGDHYVGVTLHNGAERPVKVTGWGVRLPSDRSMVVSVPTTHWEPRLPAWVQPGDNATWNLDADEVRRTSRQYGIPYGEMVAYVSLADGRQINADKGLPLKD